MAGPGAGLGGAAAGCPAHRGGPGETRTKEHQMTSNARGSGRILGSLRSADGKGIVRMEDRFDTGIDDLWSALTDPRRLARWYGEVAGDLRPGGEFHARVPSAGEATGRVDACEPPRRRLLTMRDADPQPGQPDDPAIAPPLAPHAPPPLPTSQQPPLPLAPPP